MPPGVLFCHCLPPPLKGILADWKHIQMCVTCESTLGPVGLTLQRLPNPFVLIKWGLRTSLETGVLVLQALVLASSVQMTHHALGNTPAIITPPFISPATSDEPGATPMQVGSIPYPNSIST